MKKATLVNCDSEDEIIVVPLKLSPFRTLITSIVLLLSLGLLSLPLYWKRQWFVWAFYVPTSRYNQGGLVHIVDRYGRHFTRKVTRKNINSEWAWKWISRKWQTLHLNPNVELDCSCLMFQFHKLLYIISPDCSTVNQLRSLDDGITINEIMDLSCGISSDEEIFRQQLFGLNEMELPVKSLFLLFFQELLHPFYIFQIFSVTVWLFDEYYYYSACIIIVSLCSIIWTLYLTRKSQKRVKRLGILHERVSIRRENGFIDDAWASTLVPGDVIVIPRNGCNLACDAVLLSGTCVVKESALTGESMPVNKQHINRLSTDRKLDMASDASHILFCGTEVMQARNFETELVLGFVIRTGLHSMKGVLIQSIKYPKPTSLPIYRDAIHFIIALASIAMIGLIYSFVLMAVRKKPFFKIIIRGLDVITIAVPPALPAALSSGIIFALHRLNAAKIFCISPQRINLAGLINVFCFDKTGTLTEDSISLDCVVPLHENEPFGAECSANSPRLRKELKIGLASCHTLTRVDNELLGDPLDLAVFNSTQWNLHEAGGERFGEFESLAVSVITSPQYPPDEIGVVRQFPFSSSNQRMGVITRALEGRNFSFYVKGSAEKVLPLCSSDSIPKNIYVILENYTSRGYRVLVLAYRQLPLKLAWHKLMKISMTDIEEDLRFLGLIVLRNVVKKVSSSVIQVLNRSNITTIIVTGDDVQTAVAVARECSFCYNCDLRITSSVEDFLCSQSFCDSGQLAITGTVFNHLDAKGELINFLKKIVVYARMSPDNKTRLIELLKESGKNVGMVGDGANDCGALRAAHIGISLSELEASVAAPFTSGINNVSCVPKLICEGRAALVNSFCIFKFMALYSMIQFTSVLLLYWFGTILGDFMFLYIDMFILTVLMLTMSRTKASKVLSTYPPPLKLASFEIITQVTCHIFIQLVVQITAVVIFINSSFYSPVSVEEAEHEDADILPISTIVFLVSSNMYVIHAVLLAQGPPFRQPFYRNVPFLVAIVLIMTSNTFFFFSPNNSVLQFMEISYFPHIFLKLILYSITLISLFIGWFMEIFVFKNNCTDAFHSKYVQRNSLNTHV